MLIARHSNDTLSMLCVDRVVLCNSCISVTLHFIWFCVHSWPTHLFGYGKFSLLIISYTLMYTLLSGFYNYLTRKEEYYVLIIGLDNAGKTVGFGDATLLESYDSIVMSKTWLDFIRTHKVHLYGRSWSGPR